MMQDRPTKKWAKLMASAGVATSAVGSLICVTTAKQIATSTAMRQMVHAGLAPRVRPKSLGSPILR